MKCDLCQGTKFRISPVLPKGIELPKGNKDVATFVREYHSKMAPNQVSTIHTIYCLICGNEIELWL